MKTGFRNTQWDPFLLAAQIIAIQSTLYASLGILTAFMDMFVNTNNTLDHLFQYHVSSCIWRAKIFFYLPKLYFSSKFLNNLFTFRFYRKFMLPTLVVEQ